MVFLYVENIPSKPRDGRRNIGIKAKYFNGFDKLELFNNKEIWSEDIYINSEKIIPRIMSKLNILETIDLPYFISKLGRK